MRAHQTHMWRKNRARDTRKCYHLEVASLMSKLKFQACKPGRPNNIDYRCFDRLQELQAAEAPWNLKAGTVGHPNCTGLHCPECIRELWRVVSELQSKAGSTQHRRKRILNKQCGQRQNLSRPTNQPSKVPNNRLPRQKPNKTNTNITNNAIHESKPKHNDNNKRKNQTDQKRTTA